MSLSVKAVDKPTWQYEAGMLWLLVTGKKTTINEQVTPQERLNMYCTGSNSLTQVDLLPNPLHKLPNFV